MEQFELIKSIEHSDSSQLKLINGIEIKNDIEPLKFWLN